MTQPARVLRPRQSLQVSGIPTVASEAMRMQRPARPDENPMLDFQRLQFLTFDCYGTLIDWESGLLPVLRRVLANHGKSSDEATLLTLYGEYEAVAEEGAFRPYREVLREVVRKIGEQFGFNASQQEQSSLPDSLGKWEPWPDTVAALQQLSRRFRLCIISNVDDDLFALTRPKLGVDFDQVITAQQARAYKPSSAIFDLALERIAAPRGTLLHVGQSLYHDVVPAQALGLPAAWINRPSVRSGIGAVKPVAAVPALEVSSLADLARIACA
jgi:2-haloacid dehalogenase